MARTNNIVLVVDRARSGQPYVVSTWGRVFRQISTTEMEGLPLWEAQLVEHLLDTEQFTRGSAVFSLNYGEYTNRVHVVEAPRSINIEVTPESGGRKDAR
jgi:hypothetical protein